MKYILLIALILISIQCKRITKSKDVLPEQKELLVYCENSMVQPLLDLKTKFESDWDCKVIIHNDCSQNLISLIQYSLEGDIYIPGSRFGFDKLRERGGTLVTDSVFIGYNPLVLMVEKDNPNNYSGNLSSILSNDKAIVMANPETSSLGYETQRILERSEMYNSILGNVISLSADSRGLVKSIYNNEAQVAINWRSDIYNNGNSAEVDIIAIPESDLHPPEVYIGLLSSVKNNTLAENFMVYASSNNAIGVFKKYGFNKRKSIVF